MHGGGGAGGGFGGMGGNECRDPWEVNYKRFNTRESNCMSTLILSSRNLLGSSVEFSFYSQHVFSSEKETPRQD